MSKRRIRGTFCDFKGCNESAWEQCSACGKDFCSRDGGHPSDYERKYDWDQEWQDLVRLCQSCAGTEVA